VEPELPSLGDLLEKTNHTITSAQLYKEAWMEFMQSEDCELEATGIPRYKCLHTTMVSLPMKDDNVYRKVF
jgi:hypothetical protein